MDDTRLSVRIHDYDKTKLRAQAEATGQSLSEQVREAIEFYAHLDPRFLSRINETAAKLRLPAAIVLQGIGLRRLAEDAAEEAVHGTSAKLLVEFAVTNNGPLPPETVFANIRDHHRRRLIANANRRLDQLAARIRAAIPEEKWTEKHRQIVGGAVEREARATELEHNALALGA